jgi:hypothetical protein
MRITHFTLTGADDSIDLHELADLSAEFPVAEWGILMSWPDVPRERFPGRAWRETFYATAPDARRAAHLCGSDILEALANINDRLCAELREYQRVQLNFCAGRLAPAIVDGIVAAVTSWNFKYKDGSPIRFITQCNEENRYLHQRFCSHRNHSVLFDASGGTGALPSQWPLSLPGIHCGYAGGLAPDNVIAELRKIDAINVPVAHEYEFACWIDMETGLRNDDRFDMTKAKAALRAVFQENYTAHTL